MIEEAQETVEAEPVEAEGGTAPVEEKSEPKANGKAETIVEGAEEKAPDAPYWPEDWTEKAAEHYAAGDDKAYKRELKRLGRIKDPAALYGMYREAESRLSSGGLVKVPGKDASEGDIATYRKAIGVPESPSDYLDNLTLENGATIGEADKPAVDAVTTIMHEAGATKPQVEKLLNWYYSSEEARAAAVDDSDDSFKTTSMQELKEELGSSFRRQTNGIGALFQAAPGGTDVDNDGALYNRLLAGRMADGRIIGDDPDMVRWLVGMNSELNPVATVVGDGDQSGQSITTEIKDLETRMRTDRRAYFKDETAQARYRDLIDARTKMEARR